MEPINVGNIKSERMTPSMEVLTIDEDVEVIEVDSEGAPSTQQSQPAASGSSAGPALDVRIKTEEPSAMLQDSLVSQPPDSIIKIEDVRTVAAGPSDIVMALQLADDKEARAIEMLKRKKQEIKDSLKSKKGAAVMGKMQLPNLILRLGIAIALMKRPDVMMESLFSPVGLENPWHQNLLKIYRRKLAKHNVSTEDDEILANHRGFIFLPRANSFLRALASNRYRLTLQEDELTTSLMGSSHPHFCQYCSCIHVATAHPHPQSCPLISTHGPRLLEDLKLDTEVSKAKVKVYFMGHTNLYYLPPTLRPQVMNVGNPSIGTYDVPLLATDVMKPLPNGEGTLISNIKKVITAIGQDNHRPLLIEFYEATDAPQAEAIAHLTGFANAVRICQKDYFGPLIVVVPPVRAMFGDTQQSYNEKVIHMTRLHHQGHAIGSALGVPILRMPAQVMEYTTLKEKVYYMGWIPEPLFASNGNHTREYLNRIHLWFELMMHHMIINPYTQPERT